MKYRKNIVDKIYDLWYKITPPYTGSSMDTVFGVSIYCNKNYEKRWFKWTFRAYHDHVLSRADRIWYFFYDRLISRHHIVKTSLSPGWHDIDTIMFDACFTLLGKFVEKELGSARIDTDHQYRGYRLHSADGDNEKAIDLWLWYKIELPKLIKDYNDDIDRCYGGGFKTEKDEESGFYKVIIERADEPKYEYGYPDQVKNEKLLKLMEIRQSLWT